VGSTSPNPSAVRGNGRVPSQAGGTVDPPDVVGPDVELVETPGDELEPPDVEPLETPGAGTPAGAPPHPASIPASAPARTTARTDAITTLPTSRL